MATALKIVEGAKGTESKGKKKVCFCKCCQDTGGEVMCHLHGAFSLLSVLMAYDEQEDLSMLLTEKPVGVAEIIRKVYDDIDKAIEVYTSTH